MSAQTAPTDKGVNFYSVAKEVEIGRLGAEEFARRVTVLRGPEVNEYLDKLGRELSAAAPGERFPYAFTVFLGDIVVLPMAFPSGDVAAVEAIALPGGPIFIPAELIAKVESDAELAAVLAHAISHIALRHSTRSATRSEIAGMAGTNMPLDQRKAAAVMIPIGFLMFARHFEHDADAAAVQMLAQAGYDPAGLVSYLRKLPAIAQPQFSAFPDPQLRVRDVKQAIQLLPARTYRADARRFTEWKTAVATARLP